jgi:hypothetical protein
MRAFKHVLVVFQREIVELQVMADFLGGHETNTAVSPGQIAGRRRRRLW